MNALSTNLIKQSLLHDWHLAHGAYTHIQNNAEVISHYADPASEMTQYQSLALVDLSVALPRHGFEGSATRILLEKKGYRIPPLYHGMVQDDGVFLMTLSERNFWTLDLPALSPEADITKTSDLEMNSDVYHFPLSEQNTCLGFSGKHANTVLAKIFSVDVAPESFPNETLLCTSFENINFVIARCDYRDTVNYFILFDVCCIEFFWNSLLTAMQEFGGKVVGLDSLKQKN